MTEAGLTAEQGLIYEDLLPFIWRPSDSEASPLDVVKLEAMNEEVLRFIDVLDEHPSESTIEHASLNQELAKVDVKFDLLLSLVTQLLGIYFPLPKPVQVKLTPSSVHWVSRESIVPGTNGQVEIFLSSRYPRPLVFFAEVERSDEHGHEYRVSAQFGEVSDFIRERLEKMIFRHHRRGVALARRKLVNETDEPCP